MAHQGIDRISKTPCSLGGSGRDSVPPNDREIKLSLQTCLRAPWRYLAGHRSLSQDEPGLMQRAFLTLVKFKKERFIAWVRKCWGCAGTFSYRTRSTFPKAPSSGGERVPAAWPAGVAAFCCWNDVALFFSALQPPCLTAHLALLGP